LSEPQTKEENEKQTNKRPSREAKVTSSKD